jgi:hypothetical protein
MEEIITRKFYKPIRGNGELLKSTHHVAAVRYYLQGWQDFPLGTPVEKQTNDASHLSGMDGEITLNQEDRKKVSVDEMVGHEFTLHTEKHADYEITVYKVKDNNPGKGRYSVRCKMPGGRDF